MKTHFQWPWSQVARLLAWTLLSLPAFAATITWKGGSGSWKDETRWSPQTVPDAGDTVIIGGAGAMEVRLDGSHSVSTLVLANPNATLRVAGSGQTGQAILTVANGFRNEGIIELGSEVGPYPAQLTVTTGTLTNAAGGILRAVEGSGGTRSLIANLDNRGTLAVEKGISLVLNGTLLNAPSGILGGNGTFDLTSASVTNDGVLAPGASPGILALSGSLQQRTLSRLDIEIGGFAIGSEHDQLVLNSPVLLDGSIRVTLTNGFFPKKDDAFAVLTYPSQTGAFATLDNPLPERIAWEVRYEPTVARLVVLNTAPTLAAITHRTVNEQVALSVVASATDQDLPAQTLTYSLESAPAGMTVHPSTGAISWTPTEAQGPGTFDVTVRVTDNGVPPLAQTRTFNVSVDEVNRQPVLNPVANTTVHAGTTFAISLDATDPDVPANTVTFLLVNGPVGATVSTAGRVEWTPPLTSSGSTGAFVVRVTDDGVPPQTDDQSFQVAVAGPVEILSATRHGDQWTIRWRAVAGNTYRLISATTLPATEWTPLPGEVTATGDTTSVTIPIAPEVSASFLRVEFVR